MRNILSQQLRKKRVNTTIAIPPTIPSINNLLEEIAYFNAYLLPLSQKENLQSALDTYGAVRLEKGDYSGVSVVLHTNQKLYGHPSLTRISGATIAQGTNNAVLSSVVVLSGYIDFEAGLPITNCTIKTILNAWLKTTGAKIENCLFMNMVSCGLDFDFSVSGYYRNNKFIKIQTGGGPNGTAGFTIKGNSTTPSYGNTHLWTNCLTPTGDTVVLDNLQSTSFVGLDAEMWNSEGRSIDNKSMFYVTNLGDIKVTDLGGADYSSTPTGGFNIDAANLSLIHNGIESNVASKVDIRTNVLDYGSLKNYTRKSGTVTGIDLTTKQYDVNGQNILQVSYNNNIETTITDQNTINTIKNNHLGIQKTPWARPTWETLPDPLGANWRAERIGKPDSRAYIQNLINTNKIAELPEGIFYIGSTLIIGSNFEGIVGSGSGKTIICGLTDDFPLITMQDKIVNGQNYVGTTYILSNLTLQGGSIGQFFPEDYTGTSYVNPKFVIFRDQAIGVHFYKMGGTDNCFWDNISFVNCGIGLKQEPKPIVGGDSNLSPGYIDKVVWYQGQYINCGIGTSTRAMRGNNLLSWVNCKFDGNEIAYENGSTNYGIAANCDFTNTKGEFVMRGGELSLYSCNIYNNTTTQGIANFVNMWAEGCNFLDNIQLSKFVSGNDTNITVLNSTINGNVVNRSKTGGKVDSSVFINTALPYHPALNNKFMVKVLSEVPTVVVDATVNPYPQLLVTQ